MDEEREISFISNVWNNEQNEYTDEYMKRYKYPSLLKSLSGWNNEQNQYKMNKQMIKSKYTNIFLK